MQLGVVPVAAGFRGPGWFDAEVREEPVEPGG